MPNPFLTNKGQGPLQVTLEDGNVWTNVDGDTWRDSDGNRFRLGGGIDLEETAKVIKDDKGNYEFKQGEMGGRAATKAVWELQTNGGFNIPVKTGEYDSHDREIVDFRNAQGDLLSEQLYTSGIAEVTRYTEENALNLVREDKLREEASGEKKKYSDIVGELQAAREGRHWKPTAIDEAQFARSPELFDGVAFRHNDRTIDNKSLNPLSDSWTSGWAGVQEGLGGFLDLIGQQTDVEWLERMGENWRTNAQLKINETPELTLDYTQVDSVWKGFEFVANNAVMSLPYFGIAALGTALAPFTGGASSAAAYGSIFGTYAGQAWNEMEGEKGGTQAAAAITAGAAMAALDRLGIAAVGGALFKPSSILTDAGRKNLLKEMVKKVKTENPGVTSAAALSLAKKQIDDASRTSVKDAINFVGGVDVNDLAKAEYIKNAGKAAAAGFIGEGLTEVGQEGIQSAVVAAASDTTYTRDEVINRLLNAGLAGGTIGGGIGAAGGLREGTRQTGLTQQVEKGLLDEQTAIDKLREQDIANGDIPKGVDDNIRDTREERHIDATRDVPKYNTAGYTDSRAGVHADTRRGASNVVSNAIVDIPSFLSMGKEGVMRAFRASSETAIPEAMALAYKSARKLKAMVANGLVGGTYYSGKNETTFRDSVKADFEGYVSVDKILRDRFGQKRTTNEAQRQQFSMDVSEFIESGAYAKLRNHREKGADIDYSSIPSKFHSKLNEYYDTVSDFHGGWQAQIYGNSEVYAKEHGRGIDPDDISLFNQWWKLKTPDINKIRKNKTGFKKFLKDNTNLPEAEVDRLYNDIVNNEIADDDQSVFNSDFKPWSSELTKLSASPGADQFFDPDIFRTYDNFASRSAKYISSNEYWGAKGRNVDVLLQQMLEEGASQEEVDHVAWHVKAIIDSQNGVRNRITNPYVNAAVKFSTGLAAIIGLPLSMLSSIPETALMFEGIDNDKELQQVLKEMSVEAQKLLKNGLKETKDFYFVSKGQELLSKSGLPLSATAAQQRLGVGSTSFFMDRWVQKAFKLYGIQHITAYQRRTAAAFGADYVMNRLEELSILPVNKEGILDRKQMNRRHQEMYNDLAKLGVDVDKMAEVFQRRKATRNTFDMTRDSTDRETRDVDQDTIAWVDDQMQTAIYSFVNQRVQNPGAANRPLIFQDPQLKIFTQFQGFISTWTATGLPRIANRLRYGNMDIKANTAATIMLMMALGGASQYLKDLLKYGERTPYLDDYAQIRRALLASGVLGQFERPIDLLYPLYPDRHQGFEKIWNTVVGESGPSARLATTIAGIPTAAYEGDTESALRNTLKTVPGPSVLPGVRDKIIDLLHGRPPKGDLE